MVEVIKQRTILNEEDKKFLGGLAKKCFSFTHSTFTPNMSGSPFEVKLIRYNETKLTEVELKKVLSIAKNSEDVIIYPIQSNFGFFPCYSVSVLESVFPGTDEQKTNLLYFSEHQLPEGYNFEKMKETFASKNNLRKAKSAGIEFSLDFSSYDY